jgi:hypothetical protein
MGGRVTIGSEWGIIFRRQAMGSGGGPGPGPGSAASRELQEWRERYRKAGSPSYGYECDNDYEYWLVSQINERDAKLKQAREQTKQIRDSIDKIISGEDGSAKSGTTPSAAKD